MALGWRSGLASAAFSAVLTFRRDTPVLAATTADDRVARCLGSFRLVLIPYQADAVWTLGHFLHLASFAPAHQATVWIAFWRLVR